MTHAFLDKQGKFGINTQSPAAPLHVRRWGSSGGPFHNTSMAILESAGSAYLQFSQQNQAETGILSGNTSTSIRSGLIFTADSSLIVRTGGNIDKFYFSRNGRMGINTISPQAYLHINSGTGSPGPVHSESLAIFESSSEAYIQLSQPTGIKTGILSGNSTSTTRSGVIFDSDNSVHVYAGGSTTRMTVASSGNVGINTTTPSAKLDVNGSVKIGESGNTLQAIMRLHVQVDPPSIGPYGSYTESIAHGPVANNATVMVSPSINLSDGIIIAFAYSDTGIIKVKYTNITGASINPAEHVLHITMIQ